MILLLIGGLIGLATGGATGMLIGAGVGYGISWAIRKSFIGGLRVAQNQMMDSTFSIMGALSKADGVVTRAEINVVEQIFNMLRLNDQQREQAKASFNRGKQPDFDLDRAVDDFARISRARGPLLQLFLQLQCMAVAADGKIDAAEHAMLVRVATRLGLSERDVRQLEALLRATTGGRPPPDAPARGDQLQDAYQALGVSKDASDSEVKRAYRKLISENHPDKLAARGLPESMRAVAEERSRELNKAYDLIKESRGLV
ncbi:MAG: co-chaperone DjlA [Woeseiaceae bacterium]|nr:co-chaperone DjlA [Woeseiaceae bacterium]